MQRAFYRRWWLILCAGLLLAAATIECGGGSGGGDDDDDSAGSSGDAFDDDASDDDDDAAGDDAADDDDSTPPEPEDDVDPAKRPITCGTDVFVLDTADSFVSRINAETLEFETIDTGRGPEVLRASEDCSRLLTLNVLDNSVSIIDAATADAKTVTVRPGLNAMLAAPGSSHALAYHHFDSAESGTVGYGEISIVDLSEQSVRSLVVGFPPDEVIFTPDGATALLTSETTVARVDLGTGDLSALNTGLDVNAGQKVKKITATPDGAYAFILAEGSQDLLVLDLADDSLSSINLDCYPTDLDTPEGGDASLLVCREEGFVLVVAHDDLELSTYPVTELVGSGELTRDGSRAVLFTNATPVEKVHLFTVADGSLETELTVKPITGVALAPGDDTAILFHDGGDGMPVDDFDDAMDHEHAFSVFNLNTGLIAPVQTAQLVDSVSFGESGAWAVIPMPNRMSVIAVNMATALADAYLVSSKPQDVGVLENLNKIFVLQEHPLGRISFIDLTTGKTRTVTGFLLNGGIE